MSLSMAFHIAGTDYIKYSLPVCDVTCGRWSCRRLQILRYKQITV